MPEFPIAKLPVDCMLDDAFQQSLDAFEAAGIDVHPHNSFALLAGNGKVFSCHEDRRNDTFVVPIGP